MSTKTDLSVALRRVSGERPPAPEVFATATES